MINLAVGILVCSVIVRPGPVERSPSADELRERFNAVSSEEELGVRLGSWEAGSPTAARSTALVSENIVLIAELERDRVRSVAVFMRTTSSLESVAEMLSTVAATLYAATPGVSGAAREELHQALGLDEEGWGARGLETVATLEGVTFRLIHPAGDSLVVLLVSWPGS